MMPEQVIEGGRYTDHRGTIRVVVGFVERRIFRNDTETVVRYAFEGKGLVTDGWEMRLSEFARRFEPARLRAVPS